MATESVARKRRLGRSPLEVTPLGVGCWAWGDQEYWEYGHAYGPHEAVDAFAASLQAGLDLFDTAEAYAWGRSEQILGALERKSGSRLIIATKYAPLAGRGGAAAISRGLAGSLRRLRRPQIDLYQMHWADREEAPIAEAMRMFADAVLDGRVRAVGVSNFSAGEMREAHSVLAERGVPLASNQVRYSLLHRQPEVDGVLDACRELDVALLAYSPLEQGLLTGKYGVAERPPGKRAEAPWFAPDNLAAAQPVLETLRAIAGRHDTGVAAIALAWLLAQPQVVPLAGARDASQAARNAQCLAIELSAAEREQLDDATLHWRSAG